MMPPMSGAVHMAARALHHPPTARKRVDIFVRMSYELLLISFKLNI